MTGSVLGWRAYYADGSTVDSAEAEPRDLEGGLVGVVEFLDPPYRTIVDGGSRYWWEDGRWHAEDVQWGGSGEVPDGMDPALVKDAGGLPDEEWRDMKRRMVADREWPDGD